MGIVKRRFGGNGKRPGKLFPMKNTTNYRKNAKKQINYLE
jgi:hypothetical protein